MRAVVYGPYTGSPLPGVDATLATVRDLLSRGYDVQVASPDASAAHHHLDIGGIKDTVRFARLVAGADVAVLYPTPAMFVPGHRPQRQRAARRLLGLALRRVGEVTLHLPPLARGSDPEFVGLVTADEASVVVASEADRLAVTGTGINPAAVTVAAAPEPSPAVGGSRAAWAEDLTAERTAIEAEVARRAAADREAVAAGGSADSAPVPIGLLPPLLPASPYSDRKPVRLLKGVIRRLTAWEIDPVIDHVNVLQRAIARVPSRHDERRL